VTPSINDGARKKPPSGAPSRPSTTIVAPSSAPESMYEATLSRCSRVISGPISEEASMPSPTFTFGIRWLDRLDERVGDVMRDLMLRRRAEMLDDMAHAGIGPRNGQAVLTRSGEAVRPFPSGSFYGHFGVRP